MDIELFCLEGLAAVHSRARIGCRYQMLPRRRGCNDCIPGLEQLEEQRGVWMKRVTRQQMKIEYGEGHRGLLFCIRKDPPHAAFDDRCDTPVQARITIEQSP